MGCGQSSGLDRPPTGEDSPTKCVGREAKKGKVAYADLVLGTVEEREAVLMVAEDDDSPHSDKAASPLVRQPSELKAHERRLKDKQQRDRSKSTACPHGNRSHFIPASWRGAPPNSPEVNTSFNAANTAPISGAQLSLSGNSAAPPHQLPPCSPADHSGGGGGIGLGSATEISGAFPPADGYTNRSSFSRGETLSNFRSIRAAAERLDEQSAVPSTIHTATSGSLHTESAAHGRRGVGSPMGVGSPKNGGMGLYEQAVNSRRQSLAVPAAEPAPAELVSRIQDVVSKAAANFGISADPDQYAESVAAETQVHIASLTERKMRYIVAAIDSFIAAALTSITLSDETETSSAPSSLSDGVAVVRSGPHALHISYGALPDPNPAAPEPPEGSTGKGDESPFAFNMDLAPQDVTLRASGITSPRRLSAQSQSHSQHVDEIDSWLVGGA